MTGTYVEGSASTTQTGRVNWRVIGSNGRTTFVSCHAPEFFPEDAPQAARELAERIGWTPEVIQAAKDRLSGAKPKEE